MLAQITFERFDVFMHRLYMLFKIFFSAKALMTNLTLVLLKFLMNTFNVLSKVRKLESRITAQITIERSDVFMHILYMPFKTFFLAKALMTNVTLVLLKFLMNRSDLLL